MGIFKIIVLVVGVLMFCYPIERGLGLSFIEGLIMNLGLVIALIAISPDDD